MIVRNLKKIVSSSFIKKVGLSLTALSLLVSGAVYASSQPLDDFKTSLGRAFSASAFGGDQARRFDYVEAELQKAMESYLEGNVGLDATSIPNQVAESLGIDHRTRKYSSELDRYSKLQGELQVASPCLEQINKTFIETQAAVKFASQCKADESTIGLLQVYAANTSQLRMSIIKEMSDMLSKLTASVIFCHSIADSDILDAQKKSKTLAEHAAGGRGWYQASLETIIVMMEGGGAVARSEADRQAKEYLISYSDQIRNESYNNVGLFKEALESKYTSSYGDATFKERAKGNTYIYEHQKYVYAKAYKKSGNKKSSGGGYKSSGSSYGSGGYGYKSSGSSYGSGGYGYKSSGSSYGSGGYGSKSSGSSYGSGGYGYKSSGSSYGSGGYGSKSSGSSYGSGTKAESSYTKSKGSGTYGMSEAETIESARVKLNANLKKDILAAKYWAEVVKGDKDHGYVLRVIRHQPGDDVAYKTEVYIHADKVKIDLNPNDIVGFDRAPRKKVFDIGGGFYRILTSIIL